MPELPEVESTVRYLRERVVGEKITAVKVLWDRTVGPMRADIFKEEICSREVVALTRRGKYLVFNLTGAKKNDLYLFCHLRMSGSFDVVSDAVAADKHDRVVFSLSSGKQLRFHDPRKFGRMLLTAEREHLDSKLGVEPLESEFSKEFLIELLSKKAGAIKPLLLNQRHIAGLGNIYVDEALWYAKIHPLRKANSIKGEQINGLHRSIRSVLRSAIEKAGTDFGDGVVEYGGYSPKIYGRADKPCFRCRSKIRRIVVGQRGTHLCNSCQTLRVTK